MSIQTSAYSLCRARRLCRCLSASTSRHVPGESVSYDSWASRDHGFASESVLQTLDPLAATGLFGPIGDEMLIRWIAIILVANYLLILVGRFFFHWW